MRCGIQAGFRESGAINLVGNAREQAMPMVGIRSMGLGFESLIGVRTQGRTTCAVSNEYLQILIQLSHERFEENTKRIERFRQALSQGSQQPTRKTREGGEWEDAAARRERKRAEGLTRSAQLKESRDNTPTY